MTSNLPDDVLQTAGLSCELCFLRDGSFIFPSSWFSSEDINYLVTSVGTEFYILLFVICILITFILYIDIAPSVRNKIIIIVYVSYNELRNL